MNMIASVVGRPPRNQAKEPQVLSGQLTIIYTYLITSFIILVNNHFLFTLLAYLT